MFNDLDHRFWDQIEIKIREIKENQGHGDMIKHIPLPNSENSSSSSEPRAKPRGKRPVGSAQFAFTQFLGQLLRIWRTSVSAGKKPERDLQRLTQIWSFPKIFRTKTHSSHTININQPLQERSSPFQNQTPKNIGFVVSKSTNHQQLNYSNIQWDHGQLDITEDEKGTLDHSRCILVEPLTSNHHHVWALLRTTHHNDATIPELLWLVFGGKYPAKPTKRLDGFCIPFNIPRPAGQFGKTLAKFDFPQNCEVSVSCALP